MTIVRTAAALLGLLAVAAVGVAVAGAAAPETSDQTPQEREARPVLLAMTDQEYRESLDAADSAGRAGMEQIREFLEQDRIPVVYHGERAGYITVDTMYSATPTSKSDLGPVVDEGGTVVAYWGTDIGVLPLHVVDSADFDVDKAIAGGYSSEPLAGG